MSVSTRSIGLYIVRFRHEKDNDILSGKKLIEYYNSLLFNISNKSFSDKRMELATSNKFYYLADSNGSEKKEIIFESAKTGHRPFLVDETTGLKRENPKNIHEGEAELTHLITRTDNKEIIMALEKRAVGVTINQIQSYLNSFIRSYPEKDQYFLEWDVLVLESFLERLNDFKRITTGSIFVDKKIISSEQMGYAGLDLDSTREDLEMTYKSHRGESISKTLVRKFDKLRKKGVISRIRVEGKSFNDAAIHIDTNSDAFIRKVDVDLIEDTGLVNSTHLFKILSNVIDEV
ncbi:hypothetical protein [Methanohalophilus mahii]|uniref:Uncharacterized protein n=1 Tax=Methanohalophilus mahii (strain ATCC 35705 / DSM 5219 / SLP) TaxID=547558 RepID=D5E8J2_METMS|nr:hypothetical protein [Methanohalophilus mahii]ADE37480.1 hypothetical protein Mmah_1985 [Methanohalophilus mahii DSM 5219]